MRRLIRKALRVAVAGVCLLSLLACVGTGWLWWRSGRVYGDAAEASAARTYVRAASHRDGLNLLVIRDWTERPGLRVWSSDTPADFQIYSSLNTSCGSGGSPGRRQCPARRTAT